VKLPMINLYIKHCALEKSNKWIVHLNMLISYLVITICCPFWKLSATRDVCKT